MVAIVIYAVIEVYIEDYLDEFKFIYYLWIIYFSILTLVYFSTVLLLNSKMRLLGGNFTSEIRSINSQFLVFLLAYVTRLIFFIY